MSRDGFPLTWTRRHKRGWRCECDCGHTGTLRKTFHDADRDSDIHNRVHLLRMVAA